MPDTAYLRMAMLTDPKNVTFSRGVIRALCELAEDAKTLGPQHYEVISYVRQQIGDMEREAHVSYLHRYLHTSGAGHDVLNKDDHDLAMSLCDGYGKLTVEQLHEKGLTWDWSHVRDATVESLAECRAFVEGILNGQ